MLNVDAHLELNFVFFLYSTSQGHAVTSSVAQAPMDPAPNDHSAMIFGLAQKTGMDKHSNVDMIT